MLRGVGKDEFQRRPDMRLDEMARHRATIAPAEHDVNVDRRTIVRIDADIAGERRDLDLIVHRDFAIILLVPIEIGEERVAEGTNSRSEEHTSELQSLMRLTYAVFCFKKQ